MGWATIFLIGLATWFFRQARKWPTAIAAFCAGYMGAVELAVALVSKPITDFGQLMGWI